MRFKKAWILSLAFLLTVDIRPLLLAQSDKTIGASPLTLPSETISFDAIPNQILGISPFVIAAQSSSLLPVTFASTTPAVCRISDDQVMLPGAGTCSITASQPGNASYSAATSVTRSFTVSLAKPSGSFTQAWGSPVVPAARSVVGDFNGDGVQDLATVNPSGNDVTVLLGNGSGGFTPAPGSPFAAGAGTAAIVVGDFNGDGIQDLATANGNSNNISVLLGNGSGGFTAAPGSPFAVVALEPFPISLVVGDFNGDGIEDLATANIGSNNVAVMLGNGSGGFAPGPGGPFGAGINPDFVVVGDFNGDGIQDLAVAVTDFSNGSVTVLLGDGSGLFTPAIGSPFALGTSPASLAVGDFNGDGIQDIATMNDNSENVTVLLGNGAGGFAPMTGSPFAVGLNPVSVVVGDFNGDGIEDLAISGDGSGSVTLLLGTVVGSTSQTITFGPLSTVTYGVDPFVISATSTSGLAVSFASTTPAVCTVAGNTVSVISGIACSIVASQAGNATYAAALSVTQSFTVNQLSQTINFAPLSNQALGSSPPALSATASSGLAVTYTSNTAAVCIVGFSITLLTTGTCSITANQYGNGIYAAAKPVTQSFTVFVPVQPVAAFLDQYGAPALTFNDSTIFPDAGGLLSGPPGVAQTPDGNLFIVGMDSAGGVHLNSYSYDYANPVWNGWQYSGGILDTTSGLTAAVDLNGVVWFTGRDIGDRFWINSWNGSSFGGSILVADGVFAPDSVPQIAIPSDGSIYVIGKDIGGRVWSNSYSPTSQMFTRWVDRQGVIYGQPSVTAGQDGMVYVAVRNVASESPVYITQIPAQNAPTANTWLNGGGLIDTDPQITSQDGTVYLMAEAGGNTVYLLTFAESSQTFGTWSFTNGVLNDATIAAAAGNVYIAGRDSADRIYWYSVTGNSWFFAGGAGVSSTVLTGAK